VTTARALCLVGLGAVLAGASCKCDAPAKRQPGTASATGAAAPGAAPAGSTPAPAMLQVSTSVNGGTAATIHRGWPLMITASVRHDGPAITVPASGGSWTGSARVELTAGGAAVPLSTRVAASPPGPLVVDDATIGVVTWTAAVADVDRLPAGDYQVRVIVDGTVGEPATMRVAADASPAAVEPERQLLTASMHMLAGDRAAAGAAVDLALAARPNDAGALVFKAGLVGTDDPVAGVALYDRALHQMGKHPPGAILERRNELWQQILHR